MMYLKHIFYTLLAVHSSVCVSAQESPSSPEVAFGLMKSPSTQLVILESASCTDNVCLYTFVNNQGERLTVDFVPSGVILMNEKTTGNSEAFPQYLNKVYEVTFVLKKMYDEVADITYDDWTVSAIKAAPTPPMKTEKMELVNVDCQFTDCLFYFKKSNGDTLISSAVPPHSIEMTKDERGHLRAPSQSVHTMYNVKYTTKKIKDYSTDTYFDMLVIDELKPTK